MTMMLSKLIYLFLVFATSKCEWAIVWHDEFEHFNLSVWNYYALQKCDCGKLINSISQLKLTR